MKKIKGKSFDLKHSSQIARKLKLKHIKIPFNLGQLKDLKILCMLLKTGVIITSTVLF